MHTMQTLLGAWEAVVLALFAAVCAAALAWQAARA